MKLERSDLRPEGPNEGGDEQTDERTDERTNEKSPCVLQDFVPFGAAAQKGEMCDLTFVCEWNIRTFVIFCDEQVWPIKVSSYFLCR